MRLWVLEYFEKVIILFSVKVVLLLEGKGEYYLFGFFNFG